jgi:hypothetical protein
MRGFLEKSGLSSSDSYLVKPNWFFQGKGFYTDARTLELLLECLDKVTIIESYTYQRNDGTRTITPENGKLNWDSIREQDENPGLAFCGDRLIDVDAYLSQACGIDPHKVEHICLAGEVFGKWATRLIEEAKEQPIDFGAHP